MYIFQIYATSKKSLYKIVLCSIKLLFACTVYNFIKTLTKWHQHIYKLLHLYNMHYYKFITDRIMLQADFIASEQRFSGRNDSECLKWITLFCHEDIILYVTNELFFCEETILFVTNELTYFALKKLFCMSQMNYLILPWKNNSLLQRINLFCPEEMI